MKYTDYYNHLLLENTDDVYLQAIKNNNSELCEELVLNAAHKNNYKLIVYHSTNSSHFTKFKTTNLSAHFGSLEAATDRANHLKDFSLNVVKRKHNEAGILKLILNIRNPLEMPDLAGLYQTERGDYINSDEIEDRKDEFYDDTPHAASWESETDFQEWLIQNEIITSDEFWEVQYKKDKAVELLKEKNYDGIMYENVVESPGSISYIIFDPNQVKLLESITYDDNDQIISLSKRFDNTNEDIRY
jgi:hypothetical protein